MRKMSHSEIKLISGVLRRFIVTQFALKYGKFKSSQHKSKSRKYALPFLNFRSFLHHYKYNNNYTRTPLLLSKSSRYQKILGNSVTPSKKVLYSKEKFFQWQVSQAKFSTSIPGKKSSKTTAGRHDYHEETENAINNQISAELKACFAYLSMACYFGRTDIALPGCQGYFLNMHQEEHGHAMIFINYQLKRGGHVELTPISVPESGDWCSITKALCVALEMEKLIKEKLVEVFTVAEKHKDLEVMDLVSTQFMDEQNRSVCELARLLTKASMVIDPKGEFLFDEMMFNTFVKSSEKNLMYTKKLEEEKEKFLYK